MDVLIFKFLAVWGFISLGLTPWLFLQYKSLRAYKKRSEWRLERDQELANRRFVERFGYEPTDC